MKLAFLIILNLSGLPVYAQLVTGKIVDADTKNPIGYVNIGIVGGFKGTVCDNDGSFALNLSEQNDFDTLRISIIGYYPISFAVGDFKRTFQQNLGGLVIELAKKAIVLKEVMVSPIEFKEKTEGSKGKLGVVSFETNRDTSLGTEVGTVIKVKKAPAFIRDVNFVFKGTTYDDSILFRINIYAMNNEHPAETILSEPIYVDTNITMGILTVNLEKYNLYVENDFMVALEWLQELGEKELRFGTGLKGKSFVRVTSQGDWDRFPLGSIGIFATILNVK
jgi:hypothetical protein